MAAVPERTGVAIVGAGPAGLVLAHLLGQASIPFVVVERQDDASLGRHPKAGLIEYRTVQQLRREGLAGSVLDFTVRRITSVSSAPRPGRPCSTTGRSPAGARITFTRSTSWCGGWPITGRRRGPGPVRHTVQAVCAGPAGAVVAVAGPGGHPGRSAARWWWGATAPAARSRPRCPGPGLAEHESGAPGRRDFDRGEGWVRALENDPSLNAPTTMMIGGPSPNR